MRRSHLLAVSVSALAALVLAAAMGDALARSRNPLIRSLDANQAREEVLAGRQRPLNELLPIIRGQLGGEHLQVQGLEIRGDRRVYLLRWKAPGRLMDIEVDAETGQVLHQE